MIRPCNDGDRAAIEAIVMGIQDVRDATLIRHAYVRARKQRGGVGGKLMQALVPLAGPRPMFGTWAAAH